MVLHIFNKQFCLPVCEVITPPVTVPIIKRNKTPIRLYAMHDLPTYFIELETVANNSNNNTSAKRKILIFRHKSIE